MRWRPSEASTQTSAQSAPGAQQSPLSVAALGALPQSGLPRTGPGVSPSCRRLVLPLWLPTRSTGNLRPATPFYRHGLSRRQLALRRPHQRPWQIGETPSSHPTTESHLPLSIASRFQRDPHTLSLSVFTEYLQARSSNAPAREALECFEGSQRPKSSAKRPISLIRQIELLAMLALPLRRTLHRQTQEFELPLLQAPRPRSKKISPATEENGTRQNKMKKSSCLNL